MSVPISGHMKIYNAGHKLKIPCKKEILLTSEEIAKFLPKFRAAGIKTIIKVWIDTRIAIERIIKYYKEKEVEK